MPDVVKILEYINVKPRTKTEVQKHFNMGRIPAYRALRFLVKSGDLSVIELTGNTSRVGRCFIYTAR